MEPFACDVGGRPKSFLRDRGTDRDLQLKTLHAEPPHLQSLSRWQCGVAALTPQRRQMPYVDAPGTGPSAIRAQILRHTLHVSLPGKTSIDLPWWARR